MKLPIQFRNLFQLGTVLSEDIGQAMAEWAVGGVDPRTVDSKEAPASHQAPQPQAGADYSDEQSDEEKAVIEQFEAKLLAARERGRAAFIKAWVERPNWREMPRVRRYFLALRDPWLAIATEVDQRKEPDAPAADQAANP
jgi:hypothetical protein